MQKSDNDNVKELKIEKMTLHCSTADPAKLEKSVKLLKLISGMQPIRTLSRKRIPAFKIRPGLAIGCKVTVRKNCEELLKRILTGVQQMTKKNFSDGYLSFGVKEYIEIPSIPFQRDIGILGFDVVVNLKRIGIRIEKRKLRKSVVGKRQKITKEETTDFFQNKFKINLEEEKEK